MLKMQPNKDHPLWGDKNPNWGGDNICIGAIHKWVTKNFPKPDCCQKCGKKTSKLDLANRTGIYTRNVNDYDYICRKCHINSDNRLETIYHQNPFHNKLLPKKSYVSICIKCGSVIVGHWGGKRKHCAKCLPLFKKEEDKRRYNKNRENILKQKKEYYKAKKADPATQLHEFA